MPRVNLWDVKKAQDWELKKTHQSNFGEVALPALPRSHAGLGDCGCSGCKSSTLSGCGCGCKGKGGCCSGCKSSTLSGCGCGCKGKGGCGSDITDELVRLSYEWDKAMAGLPNSAFGSTMSDIQSGVSQGMDFMENPSWESAVKLAEAGAKAASAAETSCKPDPVVMGLLSGALALLTGGIGGTLATVLGAAGSVLPSIIAGAFGCPEGKRKMGEAIKQCIAAMDKQLLYPPLIIMRGDEVKRNQSGTIEDSIGPAGTYSGWQLAPYAVAETSPDASKRIQIFIEAVVDAIGNGMDTRDAVLKAFSLASRANQQSQYSDPMASYKDSGNYTPEQIKEWASQGGWEAVLKQYSGDEKQTEEHFTFYYPGWQLVHQVIDSCVKNAIAGAAAKKTGQKIPPQALAPQPQVVSLQPGASTQSSASLLPLMIGAGVLVVALATRQE